MLENVPKLVLQLTPVECAKTCVATYVVECVETCPTTYAYRMCRNLCLQTCSVDAKIVATTCFVDVEIIAVTCFVDVETCAATYSVEVVKTYCCNLFWRIC